VLNTLRSIEPLIMGIVFVIWVGIGPFPGVLALTLHSIAALGKLYSEQVESIDPGPIEAITATGATRLQTIMYGVVPQIVPPYLAFTLYRWDINVRMSTIIGFVGGGGIGLVLQQWINQLQYRPAGVAMLAIAVVVSILDYVSAQARERIT
jgi:phosphonate transport system permease protein